MRKESEEFEKARVRYELERKETKEMVEALLANGDFLDDDGYPTDDALTIVEKWDWEDAKGWFEFIKSIWYLASWGWSEDEELDEFYAPDDKKVYRYHISTAGWSGNESIIRSMEKNSFMWGLNWVQSRRGGHYIFELREFGNE